MMPRCQERRTDCFAYDENHRGKCVALNNTCFEGDCPFYKSRDSMDYQEYREKYVDVKLGGDSYVGVFH